MQAGYLTLYRCFSQVILIPEISRLKDLRIENPAVVVLQIPPTLTRFNHPGILLYHVQAPFMVPPSARHH